MLKSKYIKGGRYLLYAAKIMGLRPIMSASAACTLCHFMLNYFFVINPIWEHRDYISVTICSQRHLMLVWYLIKSPRPAKAASAAHREAVYDMHYLQLPSYE